MESRGRVDGEPGARARRSGWLGEPGPKLKPGPKGLRHGPPRERDPKARAGSQAHELSRLFL
jgi:hypothetical protein